MSKLPFLFFSFSFLYFLFPLLSPSSPYPFAPHGPLLSIRDARSRPPSSHRRRRLRPARLHRRHRLAGACSTPLPRLRLRRGLRPASASTAEIRPALTGACYPPPPRLRLGLLPRVRLLPLAAGRCSSHERHLWGNGGKRRAEPGGATKSWLRLPFGSREVLHRCKTNRLGGLRLEPLVEPEPEPSQTDPYFL
jgi:hypothetical protein